MKRQTSISCRRALGTSEANFRVKASRLFKSPIRSVAKPDQKHVRVNSSIPIYFHRSRFLFFLFSIVLGGFLFFSGVGKALAATYYVATNGSDGNPGTSELPFLTIQGGLSALAPGDTLLVRDGIYTTPSDRIAGGNNLVGTPDGWITIKSERLYGAVLDGQNNATDYGITLYGNAQYVLLEGFQIKNFKTAGIHIQGTNTWGVHDIKVKNNWIHDIARVMVSDCTDGNGRSGGYANPYAYNITWEANVINDIGRIPNPACVVPPDDHNFRHDHGLYLQGKGQLIKNNILYNMYAGWGIKIDGYYGTNPPGIATHTVWNNVFAFAANPGPSASGHIRVFNNASVSSYDGEIMHNPENVIIENNIFYQPPVTGGNTAISATYEGIMNYSGFVVRNNITTAENVIEENIYPSEIGDKVILADNQTSRDALFRDAGNNDFHLQSTSPAINAGKDVGLTFDFEGNPIIGLPDVGAYEYIESGSRDNKEDHKRDLNVHSVKFSATATTVSVKWKTDYRSNSRVKYGFTREPKIKKKSRRKEKAHSITLSNLLPDTVYYFKASSTDGYGNKDKSRVYMVRTGKLPWQPR